MKNIFNGSRRRFLQCGMSAAAGLVATPVWAVVPHCSGLRNLAFHNLHTDEKLNVTYWHDGKYDRAACHKINHILRDHYSGDVYPMNVRLMDLLYDLQRRTSNHGTIEIISGYRSPKTNMMLASMSDGVARQSYHTRGMAIDIRMPGTSLPKVYHTALNMRRGGVGYYPDSEFVHVDVGPVRTW
jgi:uncharacterized protein YcbK (DUF882 family)